MASAQYPQSLTAEAAPGERIVVRFETMSQLQHSFCALTGTPLLRSDQGAGQFFKDFGAYMGAKVITGAEHVLGLPPDPTDFLAFPTARDELDLAVGDRRDRNAIVETITTRFGISQALLTQQIRHLSGGERSLVALAKAYALADEYQSLVLANPATWLHPDRRPLVDEVTQAFTRHGKKATILLLRGEWPEADGSPYETWNSNEHSKLAFQLIANEVEVLFPASEYPRSTPERRLIYRHPGQALKLLSPVLVRGDNGIGKSTLALLLSQVRRPDNDSVLSVRVAGVEGAARVMLQDTSRQMFAMSASDHAHHTFRYDAERRRKIDEFVETLEGELRTELGALEGAIGEADGTGRVSSILHAKITLAIERLMSRPPILILDEPSWGLSANLARLGVAIIVREAHARGVAVGIISHETSWLTGLVSSTLDLSGAADGVGVVMSAGYV